MVRAPRKRVLRTTPRSNISKVDFISELPNGRQLTHGGMTFEFRYVMSGQVTIEAEIAMFMQQWGYQQGEHYNIPQWNYPYVDWNRKRPFIITFSDDEQFVMAKLEIDLNELDND